MRTLRLLALGTLAGLLAACPSPDTTRKAMDALTTAAVVPDTLPMLLNKESPFRYPDALFSSKVQGNVMLRIYIDSTGTVWPESTLVLQSSGHPEFDSAAVRGAPRLHFLPAKLKNTPVGVAIKLPVFFRQPGGPPVPGDSVLKPKATATP
jgi:TonB family protein